MRAGLPFDAPADLRQRGQQLSGFDGFPISHAIEKENIKAGVFSPFSSLSAMTRKASAWAQQLYRTEPGVTRYPEVTFP